MESDVFTFRSADRPFPWCLLACARCRARGLRKVVINWISEERNEFRKREFGIDEFYDVDLSGTVIDINTIDNFRTCVGLNSRSTRSSFCR